MNRREAYEFIKEEQMAYCKDRHSCFMCPKYNNGLVSDHLCKFDDLTYFIMSLEENNK